MISKRISKGNQVHHETYGNCSQLPMEIRQRSSSIQSSIYDVNSSLSQIWTFRVREQDTSSWAGYQCVTLPLPQPHQPHTPTITTRCHQQQVWYPDIDCEEGRILAPLAHSETTPRPRHHTIPFNWYIFMYVGTTRDVVSFSEYSDGLCISLLKFR